MNIEITGLDCLVYLCLVATAGILLKIYQLVKEA